MLQTLIGLAVVIGIALLTIAWRAAISLSGYLWARPPHPPIDAVVESCLVLSEVDDDVVPGMRVGGIFRRQRMGCGRGPIRTVAMLDNLHTH